MAKTPKAKAPQTVESVRTAAPNWIETTEAVTRADIASAKELQQALLTEFAEGKDVGAQLTEIENELRLHGVTLKRLADAKAARDAKHSVAARRERHQRTRDELQSALNAAREFGEQSKSLLVHLVELRAHLTAMQNKREQVYAVVSDALRESDVETPFVDHHRLLRQALRDIGLADHVTRYLWDSGLGRSGVELDPTWVSVKPLSGMYAAAGVRDPDEVIAQAIAQLKKIGSAVLKSQQKDAA